MAAPLLDRLGAHDRALMLRCAIPPRSGGLPRAAWTAVTHAGGAGPSVLAAGLPALGCCTLRRGSVLALVTLVASHLLVQLVKRTVVRRRPSAVEVCTALVREPDRFSFPSGHAAAAMSVAVAYGLVYPLLAGPLLLGELGQTILVSSGGITFLVDRLERRGLVAREECEEDRRARYAVLTREGEKLVQRIFPEHARRIEKVLAGLDPAAQLETAELLKQLGRYAAEVEPESAPPRARGRKVRAKSAR